MAPVRILGLDNERLTDFRTQSTRNSALYRALDARPEVEVVGTLSPGLPVWRQRVIQALHPAPGRDLWRERAGLSPMYWRAVTAQNERLLREREGTFDVALQFYCVWAPGRTDAGRTYAMYLDATLALTRRHYPRSAPLGPVAVRRWLALEREAYGRAARIFPMSDWVRRSLIDDYGVDPARIVVAGAGTNIVAGSLEGRSWDRRVALFVGLDWKRKGGEQLLEAWPRVRRAVPDAELWVVGTRTDPAPDTPGIRWFGRVDNRAKLAELYSQASVFALPSLFDPFPHVLREALGQGLPCVTARTGAIDEIVRDGEDALIVEPGDAGALGDALVALLGDPGRAEAMGRAGFERISGEVTWDDVAGRMAPHLAEISRAASA